MISEAQKRAHVKYMREKTTKISIQYPFTNKAYIALKQYADDNNITLRKAVMDFTRDALIALGRLSLELPEDGAEDGLEDGLED